MNILLLAFALPIATILLAIVLQKILKCPLLVAATFFAILLIITFAIFDASFLVFAIIYTILAYITAVLTRLICNILRRLGLDNNNCICRDDDCCRECGCENSNRSGNCNVSSGTWRCTTRNIGRTGINQISANALTNNGRVCTCNNNSSGENEPVIILTNANDIISNNSNNDNDNDNGNNNNCRRRRNCCNCCCNRR